MEHEKLLTATAFYLATCFVFSYLVWWPWWFTTPLRSSMLTGKVHVAGMAFFKCLALSVGQFLVYLGLVEAYVQVSKA